MGRKESNQTNKRKEEFIYSLKSSAYNYIVYSTANSELHVYLYDETPNLVNFVLLSLTELYLQQIMQVSC